MSFPKYTKYKPSGVEWIDQIPTHWDRSSIKRAAKPGINTFIDGDWIETPYITTEGVRLLQCGNVGTGVFEEQGFRYVSEDTFRSLSCTEVEPNDVLICRLQSSRTILAGRACLAPQLGVKMITSVDNCILKPNSDYDPRYIVYQLSTSAYLSYIEVVARGGTRDRISRSMLGDIQLIAPPIAEQTSIATFLDRETAKIDGLVGEQRRLIELLKEKRQAVISHAVTRGLNPHAPRKPSGIEWLGEVPEHWCIIPLKRELDFLTSGSRGWADNYSDDGEFFIRIANLTRDSISLNFSDVQRVTVTDCTEGSRTKVRSGDVLFSITAYLGSVAVVPSDLEPAYVSQHVALARLRQSRLEPKWVGYVALSVVGKTWFETQSYGGTKVQLSLDDVKDLPIPVPPLIEQRDIVTRIESSLSRFDALTAEAERAIELLQERRTALISAAVTGHIDVRGLAAAEDAT